MKDKILYWFPRILAILSILFMMLFSFDCFEGDIGIRDQLMCFLMHNLPSLLITLILIFAWKSEFYGGILFAMAAVAGAVYFRGFSGNPGVLIVMAPFLITGMLFIFHHIVSGVGKKQN